MNNQPLRELPLLNIENAEFVYRQNFAGIARPPYDEAGDHYFNVKVDPNIAEALKNDGWNIAYTKPGKDAPPEVVNEFIPEPFLKVAIGFKFRPPTVILIRNGNPTLITEKTIGALDSTEFTKVDCVIRARRHEMQGGGYKAWLAEFYGHVNMSEIGAKYAYLLDQTSSDDDPTD
jgi:hypothetical protein